MLHFKQCNSSLSFQRHETAVGTGAHTIYWLIDWTSMDWHLWNLLRSLQDCTGWSHQLFPTDNNYKLWNLWFTWEMLTGNKSWYSHWTWTQVQGVQLVSLCDHNTTVEKAASVRVMQVASKPYFQMARCPNWMDAATSSKLDTLCSLWLFQEPGLLFQYIQDMVSMHLEHFPEIM